MHIITESARSRAWGSADLSSSSSPLPLLPSHPRLHGGAGWSQPWERVDASVTSPCSVLLEEAVRTLVLLCLTVFPTNSVFQPL